MKQTNEDGSISIPAAIYTKLFDYQKHGGGVIMQNTKQ